MSRKDVSKEPGAVQPVFFIYHCRRQHTIKNPAFPAWLTGFCGMLADRPLHVTSRPPDVKADRTFVYPLIKPFFATPPQPQVSHPKYKS